MPGLRRGHSRRPAQRLVPALRPQCADEGQCAKRTFLSHGHYPLDAFSRGLWPPPLGGEMGWERRKNLRRLRTAGGNRPRRTETGADHHRSRRTEKKYDQAEPLMLEATRITQANQQITANPD